MVKAVLNGHIVAESDDTKTVEGFTYFLRGDINLDALTPSNTSTRCFWKGKASYYDVTDAAGNVAIDAAFYYARPWPLAKKLVKNRVAFWKDVHIKP